MKRECYYCFYLSRLKSTTTATKTREADYCVAQLTPGPCPAPWPSSSSSYMAWLCRRSESGSNSLRLTSSWSSGIMASSLKKNEKSVVLRSKFDRKESVVSLPWGQNGSQFVCLLGGERFRKLDFKLNDELSLFEWISVGWHTLPKDALQFALFDDFA